VGVTWSIARTAGFFDVGIDPSKLVFPVFVPDQEASLPAMVFSLNIVPATGAFETFSPPQAR
jgi:hypothetical protein